ncbi:septum formation family protein [Micromonospora sp. NPDC093277]|uniref:septum formation family protein n=1 Tax=Micromonospora sp. NPDC093277 TaxID=3364291 RepID=UPI003807F5C3
MRRWWTAAAVGATAALALAGCGAPGGVDGDLTDDWAAFPAVKTFVPEAGVCHLTIQDVGYFSGYDPLDCTASHRAETLHVGTLTGADADRGAPPKAGSTGIRAAHAECDREVSKAVGADWRSGRLQLMIVFPSPQGWTGGARWFRCDLSEVVSLEDNGTHERSASLRNALAPGSPLALGCFDPKLDKDDIEEMRPVGCTAKHKAEFVGVSPFPDITYAEFQRTPKRTHEACLSVIAKYVKVPDNRDMGYRSGTIYYSPAEEEWNDGNRGVQCFLWLSDRTLTRSLKGAGSKGLPVR